MYMIWEVYPTYCPITDGRVGSEAEDIGRRYHSLGLAIKFAARVEEHHASTGGESRFVVTRVGRGPFDRDAIHHDAGDGDPLPYGSIF